MTAAIEVLAIRRLEGSSSVKAFVGIRLGGIVIKGCKIVRQEGHQKAWLATPSIKTDHGWQQVVEITSKDLRERVTDVVLEAWQQHEQPLRRPVRGTRTRERATSSPDDRDFHDDSADAIRDLEEGAGWQERNR